MAIDAAARGLGARALSQSGPNSIPGVYHFDPTFLSKWRKAKANVRSGNARARLLFAGDSTTRGANAGPIGSASANSFAGAHPNRVATLLGSAGYSANIENVVGASNYTTASVVTNDPRLTLGTGWNIPAITTAGGIFYNSPNTITASLNFAPSAQFDTIIVYYAQAGSNGSFTISVDGGAAIGATVDSSGTSTFATTTRTTTLGSHTVNIQRTIGGQVYIAAILTYDSATKKIDVLNAGWGGSKVADWADTSSVWSAQLAIGVYAPDLTILNLGINDWTAGTSLSSIATNYQALITAAKVSGDVIVCIPAPSNTASATLAAQAALAAQLKALALANNCPVVDFTYRLASYATANALGLYFDSLHPNVLGQWDMAEPIARMLLSA